MFAKIRTLGALIMAGALLSGCLLPDKFNGVIDVRSDGSYHAAYAGEGIIVPVHIDGRRALEKGDGVAQERVREDERQWLVGLRKYSGVQEVSSFGGGRVSLKFEFSGGVFDADKSLLRNMILIERDQAAPKGAADRFVRVRSTIIDKTTLASLNHHGMSSQGTLCIRTDMKVVRHNADQPPAADGGCYVWDLDVLAGDRVDMLLVRN